MAVYQIDRKEWRSIFASAGWMLLGILLGVVLDRLWEWIEAIVGVLIVVFIVFTYRAKDLRGSIPLWNIIRMLQAFAAAYAGIQFARAIDEPGEMRLWVGGLFATGVFVAFEILRRAFLDWARSR